MIILNRRHALGLIAAGTGSVAMPGLLRAQGARPSITIAVQKITNNNTLDPWNEQSNVGERVFFPNLWESLIGRDWMGTQGPVPSLATDWKRLDDRTMELKLREGVRFHNGDEMTAEDVAFSFSPERVFADTQPVGGKTIFMRLFSVEQGVLHVVAQNGFIDLLFPGRILSLPLSGPARLDRDVDLLHRHNRGDRGSRRLASLAFLQAQAILQGQLEHCIFLVLRQRGTGIGSSSKRLRQFVSS